MISDPFAALIAVPVPHPSPSPAPAPAPPTTPAPPSGPVATSAGGFIKWLVAIGALWLILVALHEYGGGAQDFGTGFAMLILVTAFLTLGPKAADNLKGMIS